MRDISKLTVGERSFGDWAAPVAREHSIARGMVHGMRFKRPFIVTQPSLTTLSSSAEALCHHTRAYYLSKTTVFRPGLGRTISVRVNGLGRERHLFFTYLSNLLTGI